MDLELIEDYFIQSASSYNHYFEALDIILDCLNIKYTDTGYTTESVDHILAGIRTTHPDLAEIMSLLIDEWCAGKYLDFKLKNGI
jgi:hypothetical protein